jgi:Holliday junction DNA helicase, RuvA subunit
MYDYITGNLIEILPTEVVIDNQGIGYKLQISLQTYADIQSSSQAKLYIYHHVREDIELWYGFNKKEERNIFLMLIEVSGIGPNTARMILSSLSTDELKTAIISGDVNRIKSIKGIGLKTAQRLIIDLKDKISKGNDNLTNILIPEQNNSIKEEALSALILLGFNKISADKVLLGIIKENPNISLEELIKASLKHL